MKNWKEQLKRHWPGFLLALSAAFCALLFLRGADYIAALLTAAVTYLIVLGAEWHWDILHWLWQKKSLPAAVLALLFAVVLDVNFCQYCIFTEKRVFFALLGFFFLYAVCLAFAIWLMQTAVQIFRTSAKTEKIVWAVYGAVGLVCAVTVCLLTTILYLPMQGEAGAWDVIYTTDTFNIYANDAFFNFNNTQNDLRQLFFPLAALPFAVWAKLFSYLLFFVPHAYAMGLIWMQWIALGLTAELLARSFSLEGGCKYAFAGLFLSCFAQLLFGLVLEQYIFGLFWSALFLFLFSRKRDVRGLSAFLGGSMLTSLALAPFAYRGTQAWRKAVWGFVKDMLIVATVFLGVVFLTGQIYQLFPAVLAEKFEELFGYGGSGISWADKLYQFTHFVSNQFAMLFPFETVQIDGQMHLSLPEYQSVGIVGIILFLLEIACFVFCRKERVAWVTGYWILFSFVLLFGLGWGTSENGLILYSSYFCWAYVTLPALALRKLTGEGKTDTTGEEKTGTRVFIGVCAAVAVVLLIVNAVALGKILAFGMEYYPVG